MKNDNTPITAIYKYNRSDKRDCRTIVSYDSLRSHLLQVTEVDIVVYFETSAGRQEKM